MLGAELVKEVDIIYMLESTEMKYPILAPVSGTIEEIRISPAQVVKVRGVIAIIEY